MIHKRFGVLFGSRKLLRDPFPLRFVVFLIISPMLLASCSAVSPQAAPAATDVPTTAAPQQPTAAPTQAPTNTPESDGSPSTQAATKPAGGNASCLVGTWAIGDFDSYVRAIIPQGAFDAGTLQYEGTTGRMLYNFSEDGKVTVRAQHFLSTFVVTVEPASMRLAISMDGSATGTYSVDGSRLTIDQLTEDKMLFAAVLDGTPMLTSSKMAEVGPLFVPPNNYADFKCSGDTLELSIPNLPDNIPSLAFKRFGG